MRPGDEIVDRGRHHVRLVDVFDHRQFVILEILHHLAGHRRVEADRLDVVPAMQIAQVLLDHIVIDRALSRRIDLAGVDPMLHHRLVVWIREQPAVARHVMLGEEDDLAARKLENDADRAQILCRRQVDANPATHFLVEIKRLQGPHAAAPRLDVDDLRCRVGPDVQPGAQKLFALGRLLPRAGGEQMESAHVERNAQHRARLQPQLLGTLLVKVLGFLVTGAVLEIFLVERPDDRELLPILVVPLENTNRGLPVVPCKTKRVAPGRRDLEKQLAAA